MSDAPLLEIAGVSKAFALARGLRASGAGSVRALDDVSLAVARHETVALVGESGSGKSTLARVVVGLLEPDAGSVLLDGADLLAGGLRPQERARKVQMVFQDPYSSLNPRRTVGQAIAEPAQVHGLLDGAEPGAFVAEMLERVGLPAAAAARLPRQLSGGQRQRVAIARALAVRPQLLIADEAVSALDVSVQAQILNLFEGLRGELGLTMLFISHQLQVVAHIADRVAVMYHGRIVELAAPEQLFERPAHPYTAGLLEAQPGRHRRGRRPAAARLADVPPGELAARGCGYRDRCPLAQAVCAEVRPPLEAVGPGRLAACHVAAAEAGEASDAAVVRAR